jgi:alanyl-tRNA synthetase
MNGHEIRRRFLAYFEKNGHKIVHSSPLLPANDPTLLFTNAGMNQFKDVFLGREQREYRRAASSQKCIRAGGKHNDLDEVGKTARHHTFFEMLGNFSFGDYFKPEAIHFAWDFLVNDLGLDPARLWFTYFGGDEEIPADAEARELWIAVGASPDRVLPFGRKDNFWQMGDEGPCGPCSEIHYFLGEDPTDAEQNHSKHVNGAGDTTMEIWNLVFMQFNRTGTGERDHNGRFQKFDLTPLPAPSVDTGAGLERLAAVLQSVKSNYETDLIKPIIDFITTLAGKKYVAHSVEGFAMRVIADHARAAAFAIADGILPGNEGRNYVLRKIMRRAIYHGREHLGFADLFFHQVCDFVVDKMREAYPELEAQRDFIGKMTRLEEERFGNTLTVGLQKLEEVFAKTNGRQPEYPELARLYDTFGTPKDLIRISLAERGFEVAEEEFESKFERAAAELQNASNIGKTQQKEKINPLYAGLAETVDSSEFRGYEVTTVENAQIVALIKADKRVDALGEADEGLIVLNETPFYAEAGGQVGDVGILFNQNANAKVLDAFAPLGGITLHKARIERGTLRVGDSVTATVDTEKRDATRRNHTATHLLHAALRETLGTHVKQAGSVVAPNFLRFDFTHYQALSEAEIAAIEDLVNRRILQNEPVSTDLLPLEEAMRSGAMALFGEKYGSTVRVLSVGDGKFSRELCGGTHVRATGDIGSFKIVSDEAIASGVRRIRAVTGFDAFRRFREDERLIDESLNVLRTQRDQLPTAIEKLQEELKRTRREVEDLRMKIATGAFGGSFANGDEAIKEIAGVKVLAKVVEGLDASAMRNLSDTLLSKLKSGVVVLGRAEDAKVSLIVRSSEPQIHAGQIVREIAPIVGGRGGGKPEMAEGGGNQPENLNEALRAIYIIIEKLLAN